MDIILPLFPLLCAKLEGSFFFQSSGTFEIHNL